MGVEVWWRAEGKTKRSQGFSGAGDEGQKSQKEGLRLEKGSGQGRRKIKNQWGATALLFGQVGGAAGWFEGDEFLGLGFFVFFSKCAKLPPLVCVVETYIYK
jgi:hypothetical protein